jgi:hypothetical protein
MTCRNAPGLAPGAFAWTVPVQDRWTPGGHQLRQLATSRSRLVADAVARARGADVDRDPAADAIVRADARARGIDLDDPATVAALRADLVDRLASARDL